MLMKAQEKAVVRVGKKKIEYDPTRPYAQLQTTRAVDRRGVRYGYLTALEPTDKRQSGSIVWRCKCDCGNETLVSAKQLATGKVKSCGCLRRETQAAKATDHAGKRYGNLVAVEPVSQRQGGGVMWRCRCDCGNDVLVRGNYLVTGERWCCGKCLPREKSRAMRYIKDRINENGDTSVILNQLLDFASKKGVDAR